MCGRYTIYDVQDLDERYSLAEKPQFVSQDNYNVAPRQRLPVVYLQDGKRVAELMQWGFTPFFVRDPTKGPRPINTMAETAWDKPMWQRAMKSFRCLIPARGFYEWKELADVHKVPYYIRPKGIDVFSFAGIYSVWTDVEGHPLYTFSILTTAPNEQMQDIHNRMPVILRPEQEAEWLNPAYTSPGHLAELLMPYTGELDIHRVSTDVNSPRNNYEHLIETIDA